MSNLRIHDNFNCTLCSKVAQACARVGAMDYGKKVLWQHNKYGLTPSVSPANYLLSYAKERNDSKLMIEIMQLMKRNHLPLQPSTADIVFSYMDSAGVGGELPATFKNLVNMQILWASDNPFTGTIPVFIGNWTQLTSLRFQGNSLEGPIQSIFSRLTSLTDLRISDLSNVSSSLAFIRDMNNLTVLVLRNNLLSGNVPSSIVEIQLQRLARDFTSTALASLNTTKDSELECAVARDQVLKAESDLKTQENPLLENSEIPELALHHNQTEIPSTSSEMIVGGLTETVDDKFHKFTFRRKRKKISLSSLDESTYLENNTSKKSASEMQRNVSEQPKSSLTVESSRDDRRLMLVARQGISLTFTR